MNKNRALRYVWFIPLISLIIQVSLIYFIDKVIPNKIDDVKGEQAFWILYLFYALIILIGSYIYLGLVCRYKRHHRTIFVFSILVLALVLIAVSFVVSDRDFVLTLSIFVAIQVCYFLPFYFGVHKCINYL